MCSKKPLKKLTMSYNRYNESNMPPAVALVVEAIKGLMMVLYFLIIYLPFQLFKYLRHKMVG